MASAAEIAKEAQKREAARRAALAKRMPTGTAKGDVVARIPEPPTATEGGGGLGPLADFLGGFGGGGDKKATTKKTNGKKTNGKKTSTKKSPVKVKANGKKTSAKKPVEVKANGKKTTTPSKTTPDKTPAPTIDSKPPETISVEQEDVWEDPGGDNWVQHDVWEDPGGDNWVQYDVWEDPGGDSWEQEDDWDDSGQGDSNWSWGWDDTGWKHGGRIKKAKKAKTKAPKPRRRPALRGRRKELKGS